MSKTTKRKRNKIELSPAWWIAYGVLIGLASAGLIWLLAGQPRGKPIALLPAPTRETSDTGTSEAEETATAPPTEIGINFPININIATLEELQQLPDIGPNIAIAILNYRDSHGPFEDVEEIQNVSGIGPRTFNAIEPLITIE